MVFASEMLVGSMSWFFQNMHTTTQSSVHLESLNSSKKVLDGRWRFMAVKITTKVKMGRLNGPLRAPFSTGRPPGEPDRHGLKRRTDRQRHASRPTSTAVDTTRRVQRMTNLTTHRITSSVGLSEHELAVWGHDHDGAYRQFSS